MTLVGDLFQTRVFSTALGQPKEFLNVFWHRLASFGGDAPGSPEAQRLADNMGVQITALMATCLEVNTTIQRVEVVDYGDVTDFATAIGSGGLPRAGGRAGQACPASIALSFRYERANPGLRSGWKRIGLLSETDVSGDAISATLKGFADALALALQQPIISSGGITFLPVVAIGVKVLGTNPSYYDPATVTYAGVGTQNSRKTPLLPNTF